MGEMLAPRVMASESGSVLGVLVHPRADAPGVVGVQGDLLKVRVTAPPTGGKANAAVEVLLAEVLRIPRSRVEVVAGGSASRKRVLAMGLAPDAVLWRLGDVLSSPPHERR